MRAKIKNLGKNAQLPPYLDADRTYQVQEVYKVTENHGRAFRIINDLSRPIMCIEHNCAHLGGGKWELTDDKL